MATWEKIKFFYDSIPGTSGSLLTATSAETANPIENIHSWLEVNKWVASTTADPHDIDIDMNTAADKSADYLAVHGSNFATIGASVLIYRSTTGAFAGEESLVFTHKPTTDSFYEEFRVVRNGGFEVWEAGASAAPTGWTKTGAGATVARALVTGDPSTPASYGVALTRSGADAGLNQVVNNYSYYQGKTVSFGCWVKASTASQVLLRINDGVGTTDSSYHSGGGGWEWISVTRTIDGSATQLKLVLLMVVDGTAYFDEAVAKVASSVASTDLSDYIQPDSNTDTHWKLRIIDHSAEPEAEIIAFGDKTELDYATVGFDPRAQRHNTNVSLSAGGYVAGIRTRHIERRMGIRFNDADQDLYDKLHAWREAHGAKQLFIGWERGNNPDEVFLMRPDPPDFDWPAREGAGEYYDINLNFAGRKAS